MPHHPALNAWLGLTSAPEPPFRRVTVLIDSRDRDYARFPTPTTYQITLPTPLHHVVAGRLIGGEIPSSYYVFTAARGNTTFSFAIQGVPYEVTIPDGNYTSETLLDALQTRVNQVLDGTALSVQFSLLMASRKCRIDCPQDIAIEAPERSLAHYLGYSGSISGKSIDGVRPLNPNPEPYVLLDVQDMGNVVEPEVHGVGGSSSLHTFAKIPITSNSFGYTFEDHTFGVNDIRPPIQRLSKLQFHWRFHDGTPVDFQGVEHAMTLEFLAMESHRG